MKPIARGSLDLAILDHLYSAHVLTALETHRRLQDQGQSCSLQAIYKRLRSMQESGILDKDRNRYFFRFPWLYEQELKAAQTRESWLEKFGSGKLLEMENGIGLSRCKSLWELHRLWRGYSLACLARDPKAEYFEWAPHPWFLASADDTEPQFIRIRANFGVKSHCVWLDDSALTKSYADQRQAALESISMTETTNPALRSKYVSVVGGFLIRALMDTKTLRKIETYFHSQADLTRLDKEASRELLHSPAMIKLEVRRDEGLANQVRQELKKIAAARNGDC